MSETEHTTRSAYDDNGAQMHKPDLGKQGKHGNPRSKPAHRVQFKHTLKWHVNTVLLNQGSKINVGFHQFIAL